RHRLRQGRGASRPGSHGRQARRSLPDRPVVDPPPLHLAGAPGRPCRATAGGDPRALGRGARSAAPVGEARSSLTEDSRLVMESWEIEAREAIRDTIARYAHGADTGRFADLVAL